MIDLSAPHEPIPNLVFPNTTVVMRDTIEAMSEAYEIARFTRSTMSYSEYVAILQELVPAGYLQFHALDRFSAPIGMMGTRVLPHVSGSWLYIQDFVVHPASRGQGIGQAIMHHALAHYRKLSVEKSFLCIDKPELHAYYTKLGFLEGASWYWKDL